MDSRTWEDNIGRLKAELISTLVHTPEAAKQAEGTFIKTLDRLNCPTLEIAAHLDDARQRAAEERKRLGRP